MFYLLVPNIEPPFPVQPLTEVQLIGSTCSQKKLQCKQQITQSWLTVYTQKGRIYIVVLFRLYYSRLINK